jgi:hypothetical protein
MGVVNNTTASQKLIKKLPAGKFLFVHHTISHSITNSGMSVNDFNEIILPKGELKKYKQVIAGHIHLSQEYDNIAITGSIFTNEVGETEKKIFTIDDTGKINWISLPCRAIYKIENPTMKELDKLDKNSIVKAIVNKKDLKKDVEKLRLKLREFDAYLLVEQYPNERETVDIENAIVDFSIEELLKLYAKTRKLDENILLKGYKLIA